MPLATEEYETLPFPVGQSPFKIKGNAYRGHIDYADANVPGGMRAAVAALSDPVQREFLCQPFMASSLYDVFPLVALAYSCARLAGTTISDYMRIRTRHQAERDLNGVYRLILRLVSPETVAARLPQITSQYFNFGSGEIRKRGPQWVEAVRGGMPVGLINWYGLVAQNYVTRALELNGARNPRARMLPPTPDGKAHGIDLVSMTFEFRWDP